MSKKIWSAEEDKILRENYPTMGEKVYELLPGRTKYACTVRASKLNIKSYTYVENWSAEEDKILRENYPTMESQVYKLLPGRTAGACKTRASKLYITAIRINWTTDEDKILREYYPTIGTEVSTILPGRTKSSCANRAHRLNIKNKVYIPGVFWTDDEIKILKTYYPILGGKVSTLLPNRSSLACFKKAKKLNITYTGKTV